MQKKVEIPLRCGAMEDSDDLDREIQRAKNLISRFKKDLDWKNDRGLQELIVSPKKNLYHFLKEIEKKFNDMEKWNDKDSKNRDLLIIPYFENIYKIIEMAYKNRQWQILYIKK